MENTAPNFDCLFQPLAIKCKHLNPRFLVTFGTCYSSQMSFPGSKLAKSWGICLQVVLQHSSAQVIVTGEICTVLYVNFNCLFWPIKCKHLNPRFLVMFCTCYSSQMPFPGPKLAKSWGICPQVVLQHSSAQVIVTREIHRVLHEYFFLGTLWPLFGFFNAFSKALILHKAQEYVLK